MEKKNILFISSWFPNKLEPTNGNFVQRHAEAVALFNEVEVLHVIGDFNQNEKFIFDDKLINGIRTLIVYYKNSHNSLLNFARRMKGYALGFKKLKKPDLVHANVLHNNMLFAVYLKKKHKIPFVITEHWTALQKEAYFQTPQKIKFFARKIGNQAEKVLPVSENLRNGLQNLGIKTEMRVITNVVDTEIFSVKERQNQPFNFLHISSLIPRKKALEIIRTAAKLHSKYPNFILNIGGDGDVETLNKLIKTLNAENFIKTFAAISYSEVAEKMQQSDCFILFSENETQGCVILESYACGKPVIATKVGGVPEFVEKNRGILIEKNNENQLYEAMENVLLKLKTFDSPENLHNFVEENFSKNAIAKKFDKIYKEILK